MPVLQETGVKFLSVFLFGKTKQHRRDENQASKRFLLAMAATAKNKNRPWNRRIIPITSLHG